MLIKEFFPQKSNVTVHIKISEFPEHKYNYISAGDAAECGDKALTEFFLNKLPDTLHNYNYLAMRAAIGGYQVIAEDFLNQLPENEREYNIVAFGAANGGHQALAEHFLNQFPIYKRDYNRVAGGAAHYGKQEIADYFLNKLPENKRDYNVVASWAGHGGCQALAEHFLNQLPRDKRDYRKVAAWAVDGGYQAIAVYFNNLKPTVNATRMPHPTPAAKSAPSATGVNSISRGRIPAGSVAASGALFTPRFNSQPQTPNMPLAATSTTSTSTESQLMTQLISRLAKLEEENVEMKNRLREFEAIEGLSRMRRS